MNVRTFVHALKFDDNGNYHCKACRKALLTVGTLEQQSWLDPEPTLIDIYECEGCNRVWRVWDGWTLGLREHKNRERTLLNKTKKELTPQNVWLHGLHPIVGKG